MTTYQTYFENEIQQYLERVDGVASLMVFGGTQQQLEIVIDPLKMARHGITINNVINKVKAANRDTSAGILGIDKKNYRLRTAAKFQSVEDPLDVVIYGRRRDQDLSAGYSNHPYRGTRTRSSPSWRAGPIP